MVRGGLAAPHEMLGLEVFYVGDSSTTAASKSHGEAETNQSRCCVHAVHLLPTSVGRDSVNRPAADSEV
jgi:hypothetical protein